MNMIGLTGCNVRAMADVAEQLLARITAEALPIAVMLYVKDACQINAMRTSSGAVAIWRIGADPQRSHLDRHLDAFLDDTRGPCALADAVNRQLQLYRSFLPPPMAAGSAADQERPPA